MTDIVSTLGRQEIVVCCGSGGVGKTTVSAALAVAIAQRYKKRVLVLTIDPARRLATALGTGDIGAEAQRIRPAQLRKAGIEVKGELHAAMLDMKSVWDRLVERYSPSPDVADRIMRNRFYQGISEAFVGSHEFMAMEELFELHAAHEYDCIVVDTPPSRSALDFLDAPDHFIDFIGGKLLSWLAGGSRVGFRALNLAARPLMSIADRLVGADVLDELAAFVGDVQRLQGSIQKHARDVYRLLRSPQVGFVVVSTLEPAAFAEAEYFVGKLRDYSMPLRALVLNRVLPAYLADPGVYDTGHLLASDETLARWMSDETGARVGADVPMEIGDLFLTYNAMARRDAAQTRRVAGLGRVPVASVPLLTTEVTGLAALREIAGALGE